mmetsp:Transcript_11991/g.24167  ORF Transcript_11991/g.24167 Transcript_11991/m.24167 type:complete len:148 (-) Transcript_11991:133-576(-)
MRLYCLGLPLLCIGIGAEHVWYVQWCHAPRAKDHSTYSKPRVNDFSYTAESSSCLYRIISSSRPKSTLADGGLLVLAGVFSDALLDDTIGNESVMVMAGEDDDLFMRAATPAGLTRRRTGERSAKPDADGRVVARMATMTMATEVKI